MNVEIDPKPVPPRKTSGMAIASLVLGLCACALPLIGHLLGIGLGIGALAWIGRSGGKLRGGGFAVAGIAVSSVNLLLFTCLTVPLFLMWRDGVQRVASANNMKQLALGWRSQENTQGRFPPAGEGPNGERHPISWRAEMLPWLEQANLYDAMCERSGDGRLPAWDDPAIEEFTSIPLAVYQNPSGLGDPLATNYLAVTGEGTIYDPERFERGVRAVQPPDGMSHTLWLVEADRELAVPWAKPQDWKYDPADPRQGLGNYRYGGFYGSAADGSVRFFSNDIDPEVLRALMTANGGETIGREQFERP